MTPAREHKRFIVWSVPIMLLGLAAVGVEAERGEVFPTMGLCALLMAVSAIAMHAFKEMRKGGSWFVD